MSLPTRGRGLKHFTRCVRFTLSHVAPYTGAWIETLSVVPTGLKLEHAKIIGRAVAPYTGAWIETKYA